MPGFMRHLINLSLSVLLSGSGSLCAENSPTNDIKEISAKLCSELISRGGVFIFFDPACPICAEYFPSIERLSAKYGSTQKFYLVISDEAQATAQNFINSYHPHCDVLLDSEANLQAALAARVTPQVFVLHAGKVVYSGRIDNRYESIGHRRSVISSNDLDLALQAISNGREPQTKTSTAVGCLLDQDKAAVKRSQKNAD